jgi:hypothetical protein
LRNALPKDAVVGRWSEQDFLVVVSERKPVDALAPQKIADHLSTPYACMLSGKVVRISLEVNADHLTFPPGCSTEDILARVTAAFG